MAQPDELEVLQLNRYSCVRAVMVTPGSTGGSSWCSEVVSTSRVTAAARSPGRPLNPALDEQLLRATQDLLVEEGFERLTMDAVAKRCGASKATIYRRWPGKTALVVASAAALFQAPEVPDAGTLREDLMVCGRAYLEQEGRRAQVMASVLSASRHDPSLRAAARAALGSPYGGVFEQVLARAVERGLVRADLDVATLARVLPAIAYQQVVARGRLITEDDVVQVVEAVLLPAARPQPGDAPAAL